MVRERSEHAFIGFLRAIKAWIAWLVLVDDGTVTEDPLATLPFVKPPKPHPDRTPVAELADMEAQIATCTSKSLEDVRDRVITLVLAESAMCRGELARMTWDDVDLKSGTIYIPNEVAKNGRGRTVGIEADSIRAIVKYQRTLFRLGESQSALPIDPGVGWPSPATQPKPGPMTIRSRWAST